MNSMSRKERTAIRRKNYRAWKHEQKQQQSAPSPVPEEPAVQETKQVQSQEETQGKTPATANNHAPRPFPSMRRGAEVPFDPDAPVRSVQLLERLRSASPDVTSEERIAIAHRLEEYAAGLDPDGKYDHEGTEIVRRGIRAGIRDGLRKFGIAWPLAEAQSPSPAPGHSTGPRTSQGKAASSQNARKHGLSNLTSTFVLLPGEDPDEWVQLLGDLRSEFQPVSRTERILVTDMAQSYWLTQRAVNLQTNSIDHPKALALYLRYQTTHHRAYYRALKQLLALQKTRAQSDAQSGASRPAFSSESTVDIEAPGIVVAAPYQELMADPLVPEAPATSTAPDSAEAEPTALPQAA
jgi:hypothetical protein